jgi:hypothetical protein
MLDQIARHLGRGRDDGIEEAAVTGCLEGTANDARASLSPRSITAAASSTWRTSVAPAPHAE